jgi:thiamine pyrophosphate-dependent acetolactate synthase large subunit-like protein
MNPITPQNVCAAIQSARADAIVVCTMSAMSAFDAAGPFPALTLSSVPLMGGAASIALGIALARPDRKVIVLDGDSSLLMELGGLANIAGSRPRNLHHFVYANRVQFNGNFCLDLPDQGRADFAGLARAAGYPVADLWTDASDLARLPQALTREGPCFVELKMPATPSRLSAANPGPEMTDLRFTRMGDESRAVRHALAQG